MLACRSAYWMPSAAPGSEWTPAQPPAWTAAPGALGAHPSSLHCPAWAAPAGCRCSWVKGCWHRRSADPSPHRLLGLGAVPVPWGGQPLRARQRQRGASLLPWMPWTRQLQGVRLGRWRTRAAAAAQGQAGSRLQQPAHRPPTRWALQVRRRRAGCCAAQGAVPRCCVAALPGMAPHQLLLAADPGSGPGIWDSARPPALTYHVLLPLLSICRPPRGRRRPAWSSSGLETRATARDLCPLGSAWPRVAGGRPCAASQACGRPPARCGWH